MGDKQSIHEARVSTVASSEWDDSFFSSAGFFVRRLSDQWNDGYVCVCEHSVEFSVQNVFFKLQLNLLILASQRRIFCNIYAGRDRHTHTHIRTCRSTYISAQQILDE